MNKKYEKCQIAGLEINSAVDLIDNGLSADTFRMQIVRDCHERPKENGGPATLPVCRDSCPFYTLTQ